jgi:acetyltransferase-like isoleucine patch superfamily enzyme
MRAVSKSLLHRLGQGLALPLAVACWAEDAASAGRSEVIFNTCGHIVAMLPGLPGAFIRRGFYTLTLERCSAHCHIGFGTIFAHRQAAVADHVYVGNYALLGSVTLDEHVLLGSRVSVLSGHALHVLDDSGRWSPFDPERLERVRIGPNTWVGEAAVIVADVGSGCMVGAGAVVTTPVRDAVVVAGNPARFVRRLDADADNG